MSCHRRPTSFGTSTHLQWQGGCAGGSRNVCTAVSCAKFVHLHAACRGPDARCHNRLMHPECISDFYAAMIRCLGASDVGSELESSCLVQVSPLRRTGCPPLATSHQGAVCFETPTCQYLIKYSSLACYRYRCIPARARYYPVWRPSDGEARCQYAQVYRFEG